VTCTSGVFMENVSTRFGYRSAWLDEERPLYPCTRVAARHRRSCYVRASTWILQLEQNDFARAAARCVGAGRWAQVCFRGFGRDAVVEARYRDFRKVYELCRLAGGFARDCYFGAARTFADGEGLAGARRAARFCAGAPQPQRAACAGGFGVVVGLVFATPESRRAACTRLAGPYGTACAEAAEAELDPSGRGAWG
jgi:hypothetical protein